MESRTSRQAVQIVLKTQIKSGVARRRLKQKERKADLSTVNTIAKDHRVNVVFIFIFVWRQHLQMQRC